MQSNNLPHLHDCGEIVNVQFSWELIEIFHFFCVELKAVKEFLFQSVFDQEHRQFVCPLRL